MSLSRQCAKEKCPRLSRALCNCCNKYLCLEHLKDHADQLNEQITPIADQFNQLAEQLNKINVDTTSFIKELDQWSFKAQQTIERFYQNKRKEFEQLFNEEKQKQEIELQRIRNQFKQILEHKEATQEDIQLLNNTLTAIEQQINSISNLNLPLNPLTISMNTKDEMTYENVLPLSTPYQTITKKDVSWFSVTASENHFLICQSSKLCLLNRDMNIEREIPWESNQIWDLFFSKTWNQFVILTEENLYTLDEQTMKLMKHFIPNEDQLKKQWYCGTTYFQTLFLSTRGQGPSIYQYELCPSIVFSKRWDCPLSCAKDEYIYDLRSNDSSLGIVILNEKVNETRFELRSLTTLERRWSFKITSSSRIYRLRSSPLILNQWLIIDAMNSLLFHLHSNGTLIKQEKYHSSPRHLVQLDEHRILVSTTRTFNLHQSFPPNTIDKKSLPKPNAN